MSNFKSIHDTLKALKNMYAEEYTDKIKSIYDFKKLRDSLEIGGDINDILLESTKLCTQKYRSIINKLRKIKKEIKALEKIM